MPTGLCLALSAFHGCQMVGFMHLTELCEGLFGLTIFRGAISNMLARMASRSARQQSRSPPPCARRRLSVDACVRSKGKAGKPTEFGEAQP